MKDPETERLERALAEGEEHGVLVEEPSDCCGGTCSSGGPFCAGPAFRLQAEKIKRQERLLEMARDAMNNLLGAGDPSLAEHERANAIMRAIDDERKKA